MNSQWTITYGTYQLSVDRRTLSYHLTETKTGTVWANGLSLGWIEIKDRATGEITRHAFGEMKLFSVSEKAGPQGKRILLGLDCQGIPVDIYLIGSEREIQIVLESNRDSKTHTVERVGLCPGLCSAPYDDASHLVIPVGEGVIVRPHELFSVAELPIWDTQRGVSMPFVGAVRCTESLQHPKSALALITDSAYGVFEVRTGFEIPASINPIYTRDRERRRIDLRIILLPAGNHITIARTYRDKIISDGSHITLRKKIQESPTLEKFIGQPMFVFGDPIRFAEHDAVNTIYSGILTEWKAQGVDGGVCVPFQPNLPGVPHLSRQKWDWITTANELGFLTCYQSDVSRAWFENLDFLTDTDDGIDNPTEEVAGVIQWDGEWFNESGYVHLNTTSRYSILQKEIATFKERSQTSVFSLAIPPLLDDYSTRHPQTRWEDMELQTEMFRIGKSQFYIIGSNNGPDWSALFCDFWWNYFTDTTRRPRIAHQSASRYTAIVPLYATVYHDSVIAYPSVPMAPTKGLAICFLRCLLSLSPMLHFIDRDYFASGKNRTDYIRATNAILHPLHQLTFHTFLTAHQFLTPDYLVEEAIYSDKTRIIINQSETESYITDDLVLPPLGFYVRHRQMEAFDALQIGEKEYQMRAWRIARSQDGKPLEQSEDTLRQEFPIP